MKSRITVLFFLLSTKILFAQQQKIESLSQFHIGAGWVPVLKFTPSTLDYTANQMARFSFGVNYLNGYIKANVQYSNMVPQGNYPNCLMVDNSIAYQYHLRFGKNFSFFAGAQLGLNTIRYEYINFSATSQSIETETTAGIEFGIQQLVLKKVALTCSYKLMRIYATPRNDLSLVDIGVVYFFEPSKKLAIWLQ